MVYVAIVLIPSHNTNPTYYFVYVSIVLIPNQYKSYLIHVEFNCFLINEVAQPTYITVYVATVLIPTHNTVPTYYFVYVSLVLIPIQYNYYLIHIEFLPVLA